MEDDNATLPFTERIIAQVEGDDALDQLFASEAQIAARAADLVAEAMASLQASSGDARIAALRRERAERILAAFPDLVPITPLVVAYLTATAWSGRTVDLALAVSEAAAIGDVIRVLAGKVGDMGLALRFSSPNADGAVVAEGADLAAAHLAIAWREVAGAIEALEQAAVHAPANPRGKAGRMGRLRAAPAVVLAEALARLWRDEGLSLAGGETGGGLDIVLRIVVGDGGGNLLANARKSIENHPPELR